MAQGGGISVFIGPRGSAIVAAVAAIAVAVALTPVITGGGGGGAFTTANLWVDTNGGTCARQGTAGAWVDAAGCATFDAAWDAASNGDRICIKTGTYNGQNVTGNKTADTTFTGNCGGTVTVQSVSYTDPCPVTTGSTEQGAALCTNANFAIYEDMNVDSLTEHGISTTVQVNGNNSTLRRVNALGTSLSIRFRGNNDTWSHGSFGVDDSTPYQRSVCGGDGQPIQFDGDNGTLEYIHVYQQGSDQTPGCGSDNGFHLDVVRFESADAPIVRNNYFEPSEAGTGYLFFSGTGSGNNGKVSGNYFSANADGSNFMQINATVGSCTITFSQNTFNDGYANDGCSDSSLHWYGNAGFHQGCSGTHDGNVWWKSTSSPCSGDTVVTSGGSIAAGLGLSATGRPTSTSSAVYNAGETVGVSDKCTDSTYSASLDFDGNTRPFSANAKCTAGAFEWAG